MLMAGLRWRKSNHRLDQIVRSEIHPVFRKVGCMLENISVIFFPKRCPICDEILEPELTEQKIHSECRNKLYPVTGAVCMQCGRPLENSTGEFCYDCNRRPRIMNQKNMSFVRTKENSSFRGVPIAQGKSMYLYQGEIKTTMYRFKYSNRREYADFFAEQAVEKYGAWLRAKGVEVIVPVPMYRKKQRVRGYNQAEVFARALSRLTGIPVDTELVLRVKDTTPQKELNDLERKNNLKSAFQKTENIVQYGSILVVDDIYTTGSTAEAVADELIKMKTCQVYFLSICIGKGM